jgi:hypothetical protein
VINQTASPVRSGWSYALDFSTNLAGALTWIPQVTNTLPVSGSLSFSNANDLQRGFYRTRLVN